MIRCSMILRTPCRHLHQLTVTLFATTVLLEVRICICICGGTPRAEGRGLLQEGACYLTTTDYWLLPLRSHRPQQTNPKFRDNNSSFSELSGTIPYYKALFIHGYRIQHCTLKDIGHSRKRSFFHFCFATLLVVVNIICSLHADESCEENATTQSGRGLLISAHK